MSKKSKKLEEIKNMVKNLDINYDEIDLSDYKKIKWWKSAIQSKT